MKGEFKRIVATGLIGLMISNFVACNNTTNVVDSNNRGNNYNTSNNYVSTGTTSVSNGDRNKTNASTNPYDDLKGSIWEIVGSSGIMIGNYRPATTDVLSQPIPLKFLTDEGLIYKKEDGRYEVNGKQPDSMYNPFKCFAYVDEKTEENDVYLLLQYASNSKAADYDDVMLATYMLKYTLDDDNYETFVKLNGDRCLQGFVQEMDEQFEPEVIFKTLATEGILLHGSPVKSVDRNKNCFPHVFVAKIDYDNQIITYGAKSSEGIRYYDLDMRKTTNWENSLSYYNITKERREELIKMETEETILGDCLTSFNIGGLSAGYPYEKAKQEYNNPKYKQELKAIDINGQEKVYARTKNYSNND